MDRARRGVALTLAGAAVLGSTLLSPVLSSAQTPAEARAPAEVRATAVTIRVLSTTPSTPAITTAPQVLTITVALENTTAQTLSTVSLSAQRGDPIGSQSALNSSLTDGYARTGGLDIEPVTPTSVVLLPHVPVITTFRTTTSVLNNGRICLCLNEVYPIDVTAGTTVDGSSKVLGGTRTYLPAFDAQPAAKLGVAWIWPLIDRPHRTADGTVFTDDALSGSVAGGRLDRALQVIEAVAPAQVPVTLVVDPDLLDELQVMAVGRYTIRPAKGPIVAGAGQQAAAAWLARLRAVLTEDPNLQLQLTPLGDPDITGLSQHQQVWAGALGPTMTADVTAALGGPPSTHTLVVPPTGSATRTVLDTVTASGAATVVLDGSTVKPSTVGDIPVSSTRVRTSTGSMNALLTSPVLQRLTQAALTGTSGAVPQLVAELAVRVVQRPGARQVALLAAPRYVDPSPAAAVRTIMSTTSSVFSQPVSTTAALEGAVAPTSTSTLRAPVSTTAGLSDRQLDGIAAAYALVPPVTSLIGGSAAGRQILSVVPDALQRAASASWGQAGTAATVGGGPAVGAVRVDALSAQLSGYLRRVSILPPSSGTGSYTLASSNSPLPISVRNDNALSVRIELSVTTVGGLPGFSATDITKQIGPNSKITLKVPTHIQRSGRIPVQAELRTQSNYPLGERVKLFVRSTVLGTIGVVITIVAGVILALALLVRFGRRVLRIRRKGDPSDTPGPRTRTPQREPA